MTSPDGRSTILEPEEGQERMKMQLGLETQTVCSKEARQPRMTANEYEIMK